jgi:hypothetical protein
MTPSAGSQGPQATADHARHDALFVVRLLDADLSSSEEERARHLVDSCDQCALLLSQVTAIARATATSLPTTRRTRDFRLTDEDAARLRRSTLAAWLDRLGRRPTLVLQPLAGALVVVGLLMAVVSAPGILPFATNSVPGEAQFAAPAVAPTLTTGAVPAPAAGARPGATSAVRADQLAPAAPSAGASPAAGNSAAPLKAGPAVASPPTAGAVASPPPAGVASAAPAAGVAPAAPEGAMNPTGPTAGAPVSPLSSPLAVAGATGAGLVPAPAPGGGAATAVGAEVHPSTASPGGVAAWQGWLAVALAGGILFLAARFVLRRRES